MLLNIYLWLFVPAIFWFWWNAIGCLVTIFVAYSVSVIIKKEQKEDLKITTYKAGKKEVFILLTYFVGICFCSFLISNIFN